ncbi:DUF3592 domain-containing protein [Formosa undariae]|uniref:DUF3592 domain-containing protein n=1 Tax=Formosa undariae TaxID=1325436 RepID=A0ABV5F2Z1_9FLAO
MIEYVYSGMLSVSIILIFFALKSYNATKTLQSDGISTKAIVIDLIRNRGDNGYTYKPVFEYTDRDNESVVFNSQISTNPSPYQVGDSVMIIYAKNGDQRKVVSFWGLYRWTIILLAIASPLLVIGGGYFLYSRG